MLCRKQNACMCKQSKEVIFKVVLEILNNNNNYNNNRSNNNRSDVLNESTVVVGHHITTNTPPLPRKLLREDVCGGAECSPGHRAERRRAAQLPGPAGC